MSTNWIDRDYTFCDFKKCGKKNTCHRYCQEPETGDSFFMFGDDYNWKKCEYYWKTEQKPKKPKKPKVTIGEYMDKMDELMANEEPQDFLIKAFDYIQSVEVIGEEEK
jgi:hypothetical protein